MHGTKDHKAYKNLVRLLHGSLCSQEYIYIIDVNSLLVLPSQMAKGPTIPPAKVGVTESEVDQVQVMYLTHRWKWPIFGGLVLECA